MTESERATALAFLASEEGRELLAEAASLPADRLTRLTRLRKRCSVEIASVAVELLELRKRGKAKFADADRMFFTPEGLEQSTGEVLANYRVQYLHNNRGYGLLDVCCGIGGDARVLAEHGPVIAVDSNPAAALCTWLNADPKHKVRWRGPHGERRIGVEGMSVLCADITRLDLQRFYNVGVRKAFFDPSRRIDTRTGERKRVRNADDYSPSLSFVQALCDVFAAVAVKLAPSVDDETLAQYHHRFDLATPTIEFISYRGECREAILLLGAFDGGAIHRAEAWNFTTDYFPSLEFDYNLARRRFTILRPDLGHVSLPPFVCARPGLSEPREWLYEPDPALTRARYLPQLAALISAKQLDPDIVYLTSIYHFETPFATTYRILEWMPYHLKNVQAKLKQLGRNVVAIKKRGVPMDPAELRKQLKGTGEAGDPPAIVVLTRRGEKQIAILCEPANPEDGHNREIDLFWQTYSGWAYPHTRLCNSID